ncbi:MAG: helix-turn-helix domain-containing protein [Chloroflexota bacterium]|nr:helix-turn-helix domain-containing protein [Chloroflexota bacterium]
MDGLERDHRRAARLRLVEGMRGGLSWSDATARAGLATGRSTAYGLLKLVNSEGEAALDDARHGHPYKLTAPIREWLLEYCRGAPGVASPAVQAEIRERFGVAVSTSQINRVRASLGVSSRSRGSGGKSRVSTE